MNREFFKRKTVEPFLRELKNAWIWTNFKFDYFIVLNGMSVGIMVMPHKEYYDEESLYSLKKTSVIPLIIY